MVVAFKFSSNTKLVNEKMSNMVARQMPYATQLALNNTAKNLVARNKRDMKRIFDRPVNFTLNAFYFKAARKHENTVTIRRKDMQKGKHYLEVQEEGGVRPQTGFEKAFAQNLPYAGILRHITPAQGTRLNKHGNMSPGFRMQMLSAMQVARDPQQRSKKFGRTNKGSKQYFIPNTTGKKAGVYQRLASGKVKKVLNFHDSSMRYRPKLRFSERMGMYGRSVYPKNLQAGLRRAMATAKLR
jgi:hypothetical protein